MIDPKNFAGKGQVAILRTSPATVVEDYARLMELAKYQNNLPKDKETLLKINISWQIWYPSCSTAPWQLEGVVKKLMADGYARERLLATHNDTVVVNGREGQLNNRHQFVQEKYGLKTAETYMNNVEWVTYEPKQPLLVLDKVYKHGVRIPKFFYGKNVLHLPTMKCVHPSTEIVLADGSLVKIGDVVEGAMNQASGAIVDEDGDTRVSARIPVFSLSDDGQVQVQTACYVWRTPLKGRRIWLVRTKTGREVRVSAEHPFLTPHGWQRAQALRVGDRVAIPRKIHVKGESQTLPSLASPNRQAIDPDTLALTQGRRFSADDKREMARAYLSGKEVKQIAQVHSTSLTSVKRIIRQARIKPRMQRNWSVAAPAKTSPEFWRWVGYFTAEGYLDERNYFAMANSDPAIQTDYVELTRILFNVQVDFKRGKEARFRSDQLAEFFTQLGWSAPLKAESKKAPPLLFKCPDEEIAAFLVGYFDGDAGISPCSDPDKQSYALSVTSKSERLIRDVQYLLTRLGIASFKSSVWNKDASSTMEKRLYHTLRVYGADLARLAQHLHLRSKHKQARMEAALRMDHDTNWDTVPLLPDMIRDMRRCLRLSQNALAEPYSRSMVSLIESGKRTPSRDLARHLIGRFDQYDCDTKLAPEIAQLQGLACETIAWDYVETVEAIESDSEYLYDLTMEAAPNFVGNGVFLHNTHVFTTITGGMKNAFGGMLDQRRHWTHSVIHDTLVDLLQIQQDIHTGLFAVMDGTMAGEGPGPRATRWHVKNVILASSDPVALDAAMAKVMGLDPMSLRFIRLAHERGLGIGNPHEIKFIGDTDASEENWHFSAYENTFASWGQHQIYHGFLHPFEHALLRTPIVPWSYFASNVYHNWYWYPFIGKQRAQAALKTEWGKFLQENYSPDRPINPGYGSRLPFAAAAGGTAAIAALALGLLLAIRKAVTN